MLADKLWPLVALGARSLAYPPTFSSTSISARANRLDKLEWTAMGDSYGSGVGAGTYLGGQRCLRYNSSYPLQLQDKGDHLPEDPKKKTLNNVVCSGAHADDVEKYQMYDKDTKHQPSYEYGDRPKFGSPNMATLTVGGDDIDFPGILFNCILETTLLGGDPKKSCEQQKEDSNNNINDPKLIDNIDGLIQKIIEKGRKGPSGNDFLLYVTGYAEFFNATTDYCDDVTFARTANPKPDGKEHTKMTKDNRKEFNDMSRRLNIKIKEAVHRNEDKNVKFIDIQASGSLDGHRFCEEGIKEPDQNNDKLWFYHYPYNEKTDQKYKDLTDKAYSAVVGDMSKADATKKYPDTNALNDAFFKELEKNQDEINTKPFWDGVFGYRAKVFHPQIPFHEHIMELLNTALEKDYKPPTTDESSKKMCELDITEYWGCRTDDSENLRADMTLKNSDGKEIFKSVKDTLDRPNIGDGAGYSIKTDGLKNPLDIEAEHTGDYIGFKYGDDLSWRTDKASGENKCSLDGDNWDAKNGPPCGGCSHNDEDYCHDISRKFKCKFAC